MRTPSDRIRHTLSFEVLGLLLVTPLGAWFFDRPMGDIGMVSLVSATIAATWTYGFNWGFDVLLQRFFGRTLKTMPERVVHAILFEIGLLTVLMPFIAWYLGVSYWEALIMDGSFSLFYVVYAFLFNIGYDRLFPDMA